MSEPTKDDQICAAIARLREALDEPDEPTTAATIHLIARENDDLANVPTRFEGTIASCPFCRQKNTTVRYLDYGDGIEIHFLHCMSCRAEGPAEGTRRAAIQAWNDRGR